MSAGVSDAKACIRQSPFDPSMLNVHVHEQVLPLHSLHFRLGWLGPQHYRERLRTRANRSAFT